MFHRGNRSFFALRLSAISTLVIPQIGVFLLLTHYCGGQSQIVGPTGPLLAMVGEDIILPCQVKPAADVISELLEWARLDLDPKFVHLRRDEVDLLLSQNSLYTGRTSLSTENLKYGNISLKLSKVKVSDEGKYRCNIPDIGHAMVQLFVGAAASPAIVSIDRTSSGGGVVLQCESAGWYPEPEVLWLDAEGNLLSAGPPETVRGPDDLYAVSSSVTVDKGHSSSFTCRVQQNNINQTREAHIRITEQLFASTSSSTIRIILILFVGFMLFPAVVFVLWKQRQKPARNEMHGDKETPGEREPLFKGSVRKDLQMKEEEQEDMNDLISLLTGHKKELESYRDKQKSQLKEVDEWRKKNQVKLEEAESKGKLGGMMKDHKKKSQLLEVKGELDKIKANYEMSLSATEDMTQKTEGVITKVRKKQKKVEDQMEEIIKQAAEEERKLAEEMAIQEETDQNTASTQ